MSHITQEQAHAMGAKGAPATEAERLLFEAWMRGHCWALSATWNGTSYVSDTETGGGVDPHAIRTRGLWAAWRDSAALAQPEPVSPARALMDVTIEDEAAKMLRDYLVQEGDDEPSPVRFLLGDGHSGHGLYLAAAEYPEEGAILLAAVAQPAKPVQPNNDEVICPNCVHQFRAIPQNVQRLMLDAGFEPPFTKPAEPLGINGLTDAETSQSMSVVGLSKKAEPVELSVDEQCDRAYKNGLKAGYGYGASGDSHGFEQSLNAYQVAMAAAKRGAV